MMLWRPFAALLAHAHIDDRKSEGSRLHDAARRVADDRIDLAEQAPVGDGIEIDKDMRMRPRMAASARVRSIRA